MGDLMKSIKAEAEAGGQPRKMKLLLASLTDEDRKDLVAALNDSSVSHSAIVKALGLRNISVGHSTVGKWRRDLTQ